jgi:uncharacterized 2Fe-2S/4Fe-4S cluster protein (DUF4445 family)
MAVANERRNKKAIVVFKPSGQVVEVEIGTLLSDAAVEAGVTLNLPCGGQGRCGRCRVRVEHGGISHRSGVRLSSAELEEGWALGCQAVIKGDAVVFVPEQEKVELEFITKTVGAERVALAAEFDGELDPSVRRAHVSIVPPSLEDQTTDWDRLLRDLSLQYGIQVPWAAICARPTGMSRPCWRWVTQSSIPTLNPGSLTYYLEIRPTGATASPSISALPQT